MPNPYDDIFEDDGPEEKVPGSPLGASNPFENEIPPPEEETLDVILQKIKDFKEKAENFSKLLSLVNAQQYKVNSGLLNLFFSPEKDYDQGSLPKELEYHALLQKHFSSIIIPMRALGEIHVETVKQFNSDIDGNYFSIEKTDQRVKGEIALAIEGIHLQRKILAEASSNLKILEDALMETENRIKIYINSGKTHNISSAEFVLLVDQRRELTEGRTTRFDYSFFNVNLLDKTAISLGIYLKETTSQYLGKLLKAFT